MCKQIRKTLFPASKHSNKARYPPFRRYGTSYAPYSHDRKHERTACHQHHRRTGGYAAPVASHKAQPEKERQSREKHAQKPCKIIVRKHTAGPHEHHARLFRAFRTVSYDKPRHAYRYRQYEHYTSPKGVKFAKKQVYHVCLFYFFINVVLTPILLSPPKGAPYHKFAGHKPFYAYSFRLGYQRETDIFNSTFHLYCARQARDIRQCLSLVLSARSRMPVITFFVYRGKSASSIQPRYPGSASRSSSTRRPLCFPNEKTSQPSLS